VKEGITQKPFNALYNREGLIEKDGNPSAALKTIILQKIFI